MKFTQPNRTITVELTEGEAEIICALVGGVAGYFDGSVRTVTDTLFIGLSDFLGPDRETSFEDFFAGTVSARK